MSPETTEITIGASSHAPDLFVGFKLALRGLAGIKLEPKAQLTRNRPGGARAILDWLRVGSM